jgi:hypothetical protein
MTLLFFYPLCFRKGLARDRIDGVIDADQLRRFDLLGYVHLRSAMLAPILSSTVLSSFSASPWMPSPAACVEANFAKRETS